LLRSWFGLLLTLLLGREANGPKSVACLNCFGGVGVKALLWLTRARFRALSGKSNATSTSYKCGETRLDSPWNESQPSLDVKIWSLAPSMASGTNR